MYLSTWHTWTSTESLPPLYWPWACLWLLIETATTGNATRRQMGLSCIRKVVECKARSKQLSSILPWFLIPFLPWVLVFIFLDEGLWPVVCNKSFSPHVAFGHGVHHSNGKQTRTRIHSDIYCLDLFHCFKFWWWQMNWFCGSLVGFGLQIFRFIKI